MTEGDEPEESKLCMLSVNVRDGQWVIRGGGSGDAPTVELLPHLSFLLIDTSMESPFISPTISVVPLTNDKFFFDFSPDNGSSVRLKILRMLLALLLLRRLFILSSDLLYSNGKGLEGATSLSSLCTDLPCSFLLGVVFDQAFTRTHTQEEERERKGRSDEKVVVSDHRFLCGTDVIRQRNLKTSAIQFMSSNV